MMAVSQALSHEKHRTHLPISELILLLLGVSQEPLSPPDLRMLIYSLLLHEGINAPSDEAINAFISKLYKAKYLKTTHGHKITLTESGKLEYARLLEFLSLDDIDFLCSISRIV